MVSVTDWTELESTARAAEASGGSVGFAIVAPDGETLARNGDRRYGAASTVKIPLMVELYRQLDRGERALDDQYRLRHDDLAAGSGVLLHLHEGIELTLGDLVYLMISISDNTATNVLIDLAGMERVNATMRSLGMVDSTLGRKMKGRPAEADEEENWATPNDYATVVGAILDGAAATAESCARMVDMLEKQQNKRRIARYLPEAEGIRWGTKTGSVLGVTNDVGFVISGKGRLIVSVFCENLPDQHAGEQVIGEISRAAMKTTGIAAPLYTS
ncbi:MAG: class A beta-lactamase-related serine hydrolase [Chloroflexota bacterium]|nr:class A beta-lactamase-related serine hydrolase [Chloroflexota bacterium]